MNILPINKNGFSKDYWGPRLWYLLHKISYKYPTLVTNNIKLFYLKYFNLIVRIIPCPYCSTHYQKEIEYNNLTNNLENRQLLIDWFKNLHNQINISNGKRVYNGFELDMLYGVPHFNHLYFNELIMYLYYLSSNNIIEKSVFIYWILTTYKIHPCDICKKESIYYFTQNDISKSTWQNNDILKTWVIGLININKNH
jgi:hypothetical protein